MLWGKPLLPFSKIEWKSKFLLLLRQESFCTIIQLLPKVYKQILYFFSHIPSSFMMTRETISFIKSKTFYLYFANSFLVFYADFTQNKTMHSCSLADKKNLNCCSKLVSGNVFRCLANKITQGKGKFYLLWIVCFLKCFILYLLLIDYLFFIGSNFSNWKRLLVSKLDYFFYPIQECNAVVTNAVSI